MAAVTSHSDFGPQENKVCHCFHCFPIYLPWSDGTGCHDLVLWILSFKPVFSLSSFTLIKRLFSSSLLSAIKVVSSACLRFDVSPRNLDSSLCFIQPGISHDVPVHPKGNQSWIFIGRTDAEAEAPILWPPDVKSQLIRKDPDAGKDWRQKEKGMTEDGWHR